MLLSRLRPWLYRHTLRYRICPLLVYSWGGWDAFLWPTLWPETQRLKVRIGESAEDVLALLPRHLTTFVFHQLLTETDQVPLERTLLCNTLAERGIQVLNACVTDISKRKVQETCRAVGIGDVAASPDGPPSELLIVKTNLNYGGEAERFLREEEKAFLGLSVSMSPIKRWEDYRILSRGEIEADWWQREHIVIQKYVDNTEGRFYRIYVLGSKCTISKIYNPAPIKKMELQFERHITLHDLSEVSEPPGTSMLGDIALFVRAFQLDYGALDIVQNDAGENFIIDVNSTPNWGPPCGQEHLLAHLRTGLDF